jgi:predicted 3-demethylubiquinone-9 3-methyltransferase (glyoxalase superfamily)
MLWYDGRAEEAALFYTGIFPRSAIAKIARCGDAGPGPAGSALTVEFTLDGQTFVALNGGPLYKFNESVSFVVNCETQEEVDHYWEKLAADGGAAIQCGWLKDKFGLFWQVTPTILPLLLSGPDAQRAQRVLVAMMGMTKLDIKKLEEA